MSNVTIAGGTSNLPVANSIDGSADYIPIYTASAAATQAINRNTYLGLSSAPVGLTDSQTLTNKILTSPTINGATLSGTLSGTYTIGGTPTFPSSVVTLTGSQTLTNKVLTSPTINSPTITNASITTDSVNGFTTSNSGTVYGVSVTTGQISGASSVLPAALATGIQTTKFSNPYKFLAYLSANTGSVAANVPTNVGFDTVLFDTGSNFTTGASAKFTAPVAGFYKFDTTVKIVPVANDYFVVYLYKNGSAYAQLFTANSPNTNALSVMGGLTMQLAANDYIQIIFEHFVAGNDVFAGGTAPYQSLFGGFLVSAT